MSQGLDHQGFRRWGESSVVGLWTLVNLAFVRPFSFLCLCLWQQHSLQSQRDCDCFHFHLDLASPLEWVAEPLWRAECQCGFAGCGLTVDVREWVNLPRPVEARAVAAVAWACVLVLALDSLVSPTWFSLANTTPHHTAPHRTGRLDVSGSLTARRIFVADFLFLVLLIFVYILHRRSSTTTASQSIPLSIATTKMPNTDCVPLPKARCQMPCYR